MERDNEILKQCEDILQILHSIKHEGAENIRRKLDRLFPDWKQVEWYNPKKATAFEYLFWTVLYREE